MGSKALLFFALLGLSFNIGCNNNSNTRTPIGVGRGVPVPGSGSPVGSPGATLSPGWGMVISNSGEDQFNQEIKKFVSATINPVEMGRVSSTFEQQEATKTGVRFYGKVDVTVDGYINANNSNLVLYIWDDKVGTAGTDGSKNPAYIVNYTHISRATVNSQRATLEFEDNYSRLTLDGDYSSGTYEGSISYVNLTSYDSAIAASQGQLGVFRIRTCDFFRCDGVRN